MAHKPGRKESRIRTPPFMEKKRAKGTELIPSPIVEESKSVSSTVLKGDEIQALAIKTEDLEKFHPPHRPSEPKIPISRSFLVRKKRPQEGKKKTKFLVAYPAASDIAVKDLDYSGTDGLHFDAYGQILPHSILGSLHELKREALARGNTQMAGLVTDSPFPNDLLVMVEKFEKEKYAEEQEKAPCVLPKQYGALENWKYHMTLRKQQMRTLSRYLRVPADELLMTASDNYRQIEEERYAIDRTLPAIGPGKGYRVGSEFWNQTEPIGNEMSGLMMTLTQRERGYPAPFTHVGRPPNIIKETGCSFPVKKRNWKWDESLYLLQRRHELREILEEMNFAQVEIDGLEVIGKGHPFTSVSVDSLLSFEEEEKTLPEEKENMDPLWEYPDVIPEVILGPSLQFCGKAARWVGTTSSHRDEIGICTRITFEVLAIERALSVLEVANDGTAAIWYEWRRLPHLSTLLELPIYNKIQRFYFNTSPGVILPGESINFSFLFKSPNSGIFSEVWEFCTHPVLLGGASLQVSLWGIALYEDKTYEIRQALEAELEDKQTVALAKDVVQELLDGIRSPERPLTPVDAYITEEELFHRKNPQLHYQHHVVKEMHQLWQQHIASPVPEEYQDLQSIQAKEKRSSKNWNLSIDDFKQAVLSIPEDKTCEELLFQLNKAILEMCIPAVKTHSELLNQICLQLWREAIDGLVGYSLMFRSMMGIPEKEFALEGTADSKRVVKGRKEEKKLTSVAEEKKVTGGKEKEERKASKTVGKEKAADKEERPSSKKGRKASKFLSQGKGLSGSRESIDLFTSDSRVNPIIMEKYQESLYTEVYGLLVAVVENFVFLSEELKSKTVQEQEEEEYKHFVEASDCWLIRIE